MPAVVVTVLEEGVLLPRQVSMQEMAGGILISLALVQMTLQELQTQLT